MNTLARFVAFILLTGILFYISCKKEYSCENCPSNPPGSTNKSPIANAGPDQTIILPMDSVSLDGSASSDPDGAISSSQWIKISGPASFTINIASATRTIVKNLTAGAYRFELKVTDNGGLSAKDTMLVIVDSMITTNHPPVANAGNDTTITLPANTVTLDGRLSADPDNNIINYSWTKISGPSAFNVANTSIVQTQATNLLQGIYKFELKVTDAGGLSAKDTMQVTVNPLMNNNCILSQTLIGTLSIQRSQVNIIEVGNKIVFAGGYTNMGISNKVDIYNESNGSWSTAELSLTRDNMGITTSGNKIYFAGGRNGNVFSRVDIYDASNNSWSTAELSEPRENIIAAAAGNKVLFAGGSSNTGESNKVDIYDQANGTWSTATLSNPTFSNYFNGYHVFAQQGVVSAGNKIYISTGSNNIDIYDTQTNTWSTHIISPNQLAERRVVLLDNKIYFSGAVPGSARPDYVYANTLETYDISSGNWSSVNMSQSRVYMAAMAGDDKIFWAGGFDSSWIVNGEQQIQILNNIEIYDVNTGLHSFHYLPGNGFVKALKTNNKIFFSSANYTEIYDMNNHSWSVCSFFWNQALAVGNSIYHVGEDNYQVWKLEF
ncbi:MAG TPA: PKD domain-containing protein [Chitinophagaceae bacterium]|nr:PKD domain-containing protein [Chitinophagaceae bacterium]